jgi:hypothetical protein
LETPCITLLLWRNERTVAGAVPNKGNAMIRIVLVAGLTFLSGCNQARQPKPSNDNSSAVANNAQQATPKPPPTATMIVQNDRTPLIESKGPIDPKSVEAAGQVVQHYAALIEQKRFGEAAKLWTDTDAAAKFAGALHPETHTEIGNLRGSEGAAGSIYTTVPVVFYGDTFRRAANVILRRVNDVPGSTEAERRWHIERIDWTGPS